jgi:hypothetical protein
VGRFEHNGEWNSGLDSPHLTNHGPINYANKFGFSCAATSDNILVAGISASRCLVFFSIVDDQQPGRCLFKLEAEKDRVIHKILFGNRSTELAILYILPASHKEIWHFYSIGTVPVKTSTRKSSSTSEIPDNSPFTLNSVVEVDMTFRHDNQQLVYTTRDAKFSEDGHKVVSCTAHAYGTVLICILSKDDRNGWRLWGRRQIRRNLHNWDEDCLGYTGITL